jgi:proteasome assembly chaperone (PAC2) family protein
MMSMRSDGKHERSKPLRFLARRRPGALERSELRPRASHRVLVAAFEGWNDAGEAASYAATFLARSWGAIPVAEIDAEEYFDFTEVRPETSIVDGAIRKIVWPTTTFSLASAPSGERMTRDVILLRGPEPQLRWKSYCESIISFCHRFGVESVLCLGAYLSEVTHSHPVPISGSSGDERLEVRDGVSPSLYEGPTGIVGVLGAALTRSGISNASVWASVPCYSLPVSAKAALALVNTATRLLGRSVDATGLAKEAADYERRMDELVREDENVAAYVARITEMEDQIGSEPSTEGLAEEIERYLRDGRSG